MLPVAASRAVGLLSDADPPEMFAAHLEAADALATPFKSDVFDFSTSGVTAAIGKAAGKFSRMRKTPPPREVYTVHRKLAGCFEAARKVGGRVEGRRALEEAGRWRGKG